MINIRYTIGSKAHETEFKTESALVKWIKENYKYKILEISGTAEKGIVLKNIDLSGVTYAEECKKAEEEHREFVAAINNDDLENAVEEFFDVMQSQLGVMYMKFGITAPEVMKKYPNHLEKIKNRPRMKED